MAIREVDWLELPDHLTTFVSDKLSRCDFIRFGAVCKPWNSVYNAHSRHSSPHQIPLLLLHRFEYGVHDVYDLGENRVSRFQLSVHSGITESNVFAYCRGSDHGWLAMVWSNNQVQVCLTNPFFSQDMNIKLPNVNRKYCKFGHSVMKIVLSADPASEPDFLVMLIINERGGRLALLKPADAKTDWTYIDTHSEYIEEAIYYRDQFYFVDNIGTLFAIDNHKDQVVLVAPSPCSTFEPEYDSTKNFHLVELLSGELLLTKRLRKYIIDEELFYTVGFSAYKMSNPLVEQPKWIEVQSLCGETIFLDDYSSLSLRASEFPECKPNCIYFFEVGYFYTEYNSGILHHNHDDFVNHYVIRPYYVGVFNLVDETVIERCCPIENPTISCGERPFFIQPKLLRH